MQEGVKCILKDELVAYCGLHILKHLQTLTLFMLSSHKSAFNASDSRGGCVSSGYYLAKNTNWEFAES